MNRYQKVIVEHYGNGDFSYVTTEEQSKDIGDSLFTFLITEFANQEGCEDRITALSRCDTIIKDLQVIQHQLEQLND